MIVWVDAQLSPAIAQFIEQELGVSGARMWANFVADATRGSNDLAMIVPSIRDKFGP